VAPGTRTVHASIIGVAVGVFYNPLKFLINSSSYHDGYL